VSSCLLLSIIYHHHIYFKTRLWLSDGACLFLNPWCGAHIKSQSAESFPSRTRRPRPWPWILGCLRTCCSFMCEKANLSLLTAVSSNLSCARNHELQQLACFRITPLEVERPLLFLIIGVGCAHVVFEPEITNISSSMVLRTVHAMSGLLSGRTNYRQVTRVGHDRHVRQPQKW
jgi:hypothetical protein